MRRDLFFFFFSSNAIRKLPSKLLERKETKQAERMNEVAQDGKG
jgi:hypothetical protein